MGDLEITMDTTTDASVVARELDTEWVPDGGREPRWFCRRCNAPVPAVRERGRPKVRAFRTGYVAVFLTCGHTAAASRDRVADPASAPLCQRDLFGNGN